MKQNATLGTIAYCYHLLTANTITHYTIQHQEEKAEDLFDCVSGFQKSAAGGKKYWSSFLCVQFYSPSKEVFEVKYLK